MTTNEKLIQEGIDYEVLNTVCIEKNLNPEQIATLSGIPEGTVKNILTGKTKNPGVVTLEPICNVLGVPIDRVLRQEEQKKIEKQGIKENDAAVLALKEIYDLQITTMKETNELHINNIRAHYEQHHKDLVDNFGSRLVDKNEQIKYLKKENFIRGLIIGLFAAIFVILFIMEILHPQHGWLRY